MHELRTITVDPDYEDFSKRNVFPIVKESLAYAKSRPLVDLKMTYKIYRLFNNFSLTHTESEVTKSSSTPGKVKLPITDETIANFSIEFDEKGFYIAPSNQLIGTGMTKVSDIIEYGIIYSEILLDYKTGTEELLYPYFEVFLPRSNKTVYWAFDKDISYIINGDADLIVRLHDKVMALIDEYNKNKTK
jgi:hypothetical protein